jgi:hypothetical protein
MNPVVRATGAQIEADAKRLELSPVILDDLIGQYAPTISPGEIGLIVVDSVVDLGKGKFITTQNCKRCDSPMSAMERYKEVDGVGDDKAKCLLFGLVDVQQQLPGAKIMVVVGLNDETSIFAESSGWLQ